MQQNHGPRLGPSRGRGLGVFATRRLSALRYLPSYGGKGTSDKAVKKKYGRCDGVYVMGLGRRSFDAQVSHSWTVMMNHPFRTEAANVRVVGLSKDKHFTHGQLLRDVHAGEELLIDYNGDPESGARYNFKPMKGCTSTTEDLLDWCSGKNVSPKVHITRKGEANNSNK